MMFRQSMGLICMVGIAITAWAGPLKAIERMQIRVAGATFKPFPVAISDVVSAGGDASLAAQAGQSVLSLLEKDVAWSRQLLLVPKKTYLDAQGEAFERPLYSKWQSIGASGLIRASVKISPDMRHMALQLRFFDVEHQRLQVSQACQAELNKPNLCVHAFLDEVIRAVTTEKGVFSSRIAFVRRVAGRKSIFACDVDGGNVEKLVEVGNLSLLPAWDTSGRNLLFTSFLRGTADLYRQALVTGRVDLLSHRPGLNTGAKVSPDGQNIALTLSIDGDTEIYLMRWDGSNLTRLTHSWGQDVSPSFSPDGSQIAFVSSRSGNPHIYVMNKDGTEQRRLTFQGTYNQEPAWSPKTDGLIAFTARDEELNFDIFSVDPKTSEIRRLTQDQGSNQTPSFAPDGQHIAFISKRDPKNLPGLWVMDADGQNQHSLVPELTDCETPAWGPRL